MTDAAAHDELLVLNGIDVDTGGYLTPQLALTHVAGWLRGDAAPPPGLRERELRRGRRDDEDHFGVVYGRDPQDLAWAGRASLPRPTRPARRSARGRGAAARPRWRPCRWSG